MKFDAVGKVVLPFSRQEQAHFILNGRACSGAAPRHLMLFFGQTGKGPRPMHSGP